MGPPLLTDFRSLESGGQILDFSSLKQIIDGREIQIVTHDASFTVQRLRDLPFAGHIRDYEYLEEKSMHHHQETTRERQDGAWILFLTASLWSYPGESYPWAAKKKRKIKRCGPSISSPRQIVNLEDWNL